MTFKKNLFIMCLCVFSQYSYSFAGTNTLHQKSDKDSISAASALTLLNQAKIKLMTESGQIQRKGRALSPEELNRVKVLTASLKDLETLIKNLNAVVVAKAKSEVTNQPQGQFEKVK